MLSPITGHHPMPQGVLERLHQLQIFVPDDSASKQVRASELILHGPKCTAFYEITSAVNKLYFAPSECHPTCLHIPCVPGFELKPYYVNDVPYVNVSFKQGLCSSLVTPWHKHKTMGAILNQFAASSNGCCKLYILVREDHRPLCDPDHPNDIIIRSIDALRQNLEMYAKKQEHPIDVHWCVLREPGDYVVWPSGWWHLIFTMHIDELPAKLHELQEIAGPGIRLQPSIEPSMPPSSRATRTRKRPLEHGDIWCMAIATEVVEAVDVD